MLTIPENELSILTRYIQDTTYYRATNEMSKDWLKDWGTQKENLYKLLGGNLMVSKEVNLSMTEYQIDELLGKDEEISTKQKNFFNFLHRAIRYALFGINYDPDGNEYYQIYKKYASNELHDKTFDYVMFCDYLYAIFGWDSFRNNCLRNLPHNGTIKIEKDGHYLTFHNGEKYFRAANKLIKFFDKEFKEYDKVHIPAHYPIYEDTYEEALHDLEYVRLAYSRIVQTDKMDATLTLSIHPLDYVTASDNESGWRSCMNWRENGEYHTGTIEMMNSPIVLIAYLENHNTPFYMTNMDDEWTNKQWRTWVIVTDEIISTVMGYPYKSDELDNIIVDWIKELAHDNLNYDYSDTVSFNDGTFCLDSLFDGNNNPCVSFRTNLMYNDCGRERQWAAIRANLKNFRKRYVNYSGAAYCYECGEDLQQYDKHDSALCPACSGAFQCECCGDWVDEDNAVYIERYDCYICQNCYENEYCTCDIDGDVIPYRESEVIAYRTPCLNTITNTIKASAYEFTVCEDCYEKLKPYLGYYEDEESRTYLDPNTPAEVMEKIFGRAQYISKIEFYHGDDHLFHLMNEDN